MHLSPSTYIRTTQHEPDQYCFISNRQSTFNAPSSDTSDNERPVVVEWPSQVPHPKSQSAIPNPAHFYLNRFYENRVQMRRAHIAKTLREVIQIAHELLHEIELQEPRFINTLKLVHTNDSTKNSHHHDDNDKSISNNIQHSVFKVNAHLSNEVGLNNAQLSVNDTTTPNLFPAESSETPPPPSQYAFDSNGYKSGTCYYDGVKVLSSTYFEITLFLNQMGVFNFVDDGNIPGGAILKLSDGRKRSMSLWVEFITASGYLSARKIRTRFYSLVSQAIEKSTYRSIIRMAHNTSEVKLYIRDRYTVQITPGFRCSGLWPRSASHWPSANQLASSWPPSSVVSRAKREGFCLLSQESVGPFKDKQQALVEGDAWFLDFDDAQDRLLGESKRRRCYSTLKTLVDKHLTGSNHNGSCVIKECDIKTLVLHECDKHPSDNDWTDETMGDRLNGILMQLISCLQHRRCPHYILSQLDIFRGNSPMEMDILAKQTWRLLRELLTCPQALEYL